MSKPPKPSKPTPDFPLYPHSNGRWAKCINRRTYYFGEWGDPDGALRDYETFLSGGTRIEPKQPPRSKGPRKPHPDFPLYAHKNGQWAKTIRGRSYYFGPWEDPNKALENYLQQKDDLLAGRSPTPTGDATVKQAVNHFLASKKAAMTSGELSERTYAGYLEVCLRLVKHIDRNRTVASLRPADFENIRNQLSKYRGLVSLSNDITRIRMVFKYAFDQELIERPVRYGQAFRKPRKAALRREKLKKGPVMFEADQIRLMLSEAHYKLRAMILLGINCGFGNAEVPLQISEHRYPLVR